MNRRQKKKLLGNLRRALDLDIVTEPWLMNVAVKSDAVLTLEAIGAYLRKNPDYIPHQIRDNHVPLGYRR